MCYVRNTDMKYAHTRAGGSFGFNENTVPLKPRRDLSREGCVEGFFFDPKISNGFLPRNTRFKRGQSSLSFSNWMLQSSNDSNWGRAYNF